MIMIQSHIKQPTFQRVLLLLLDSVGVGALPDAADYGDIGASTVQHTLSSQPGLTLPHLESLGLMALPGLEQFSTGKAIIGRYGRCLELSRGKDSIVGHWEIMGSVTEHAFDTFPQGFPADLLRSVTDTIGRDILDGGVASGTEIIARLGKTHQETGFPILYTSADSVLQLAAHEETVPLSQLYAWCEAIRRLMDESSYHIGRVIARPFLGAPGDYTRTPNRHDYAAFPPTVTDLELLIGAGIPIHSIGKPADIFPQVQFTTTRKTSDNLEGMAAAKEALLRKNGLIFVNLLDFDMKWGHRRDAASYAAGLNALDDFLPELLAAMDDQTLLIITADHGCDPCHTGTDHTREHIPFLLYHHGVTPGPIGLRETFADVGATILSALGGESPAIGTSVL